MRATKTLPANYRLLRILDFSSRRTSVWLNLAAVPLLFVYGWLFTKIIYYFRSINTSAAGTWGLFTAFSGYELIVLLLCIAFMLIFHEIIHGAFFWIFSGEKPKFALKTWYAFAAAPDWCFPPFQYAVIGISPFLVISILSIAFASFVHASIVPYLIYIATFNAAGALGDMIVVSWVLRQPASIMVQDQGDKYLTFGPDHV